VPGVTIRRDLPPQDRDLVPQHEDLHVLGRLAAAQLPAAARRPWIIGLNQSRLVLAMPIVFPSQRCAVSLASTHDRLAVAPDGTLVVEPVTHLGLAYDHRFCTDRDAVAVLSSLKAAIEAPERLAGR
jgi:hypothetical protein